MNCTPESLVEASKCYDCIPQGMQTAVQAMLSCEWANVTGGICDNPVVTDWLQRLANDFQPMPSLATIHAVCDFCDGLDASGLTPKMLVINPVIPDSILSMRYPLIYQAANGFSPWFNAGFIAADLNVDGIQDSTGAATKYMLTGFSPSVHWGADPSNAGLTVYESDVTSGIVLSEVMLGSNDVGLMQFIIAPWDPATTDFLERCWANNRVAGMAVDTPAFYSSNRTTAQRLDVYQANSIIPFNTLMTDLVNEGASFPNTTTVGFMALNQPGVPASICYGRCSFASIHEPLTAAEAQDFFDVIQILRMQLGGGWI